ALGALPEGAWAAPNRDGPLDGQLAIPELVDSGGAVVVSIDLAGSRRRSQRD
ncbi:MAG: hypothetical protein H0V19_10650, partial [Euzebyales bacterium]|nr:hypothetical protein [Euzebyales bacterium]